MSKQTVFTYLLWNAGILFGIGACSGNAYIMFAGTTVSAICIYALRT